MYLGQAGFAGFILFFFRTQTVGAHSNCLREAFPTIHLTLFERWIKHITQYHLENTEGTIAIYCTWMCQSFLMHSHFNKAETRMSKDKFKLKWYHIDLAIIWFNTQSHFRLVPILNRKLFDLINFVSQRTVMKMQN